MAMGEGPHKLPVKGPLRKAIGKGGGRDVVLRLEERSLGIRQARPTPWYPCDRMAGCSPRSSRWSPAAFLWSALASIRHPVNSIRLRRSAAMASFAGRGIFPSTLAPSGRVLPRRELTLGMIGAVGFIPGAGLLGGSCQQARQNDMVCRKFFGD